MMDNSAKAKLLFSYFLSNFDSIFNNKNPRWIRNEIYGLDTFESEYPNASDIINAAGFRFGQISTHFILKDNQNYILAVLQFDHSTEKLRYYINREYTRKFIEAVRATNIERPGTNTKAWFVFTYSKYHNNITIEKESDNSIKAIHINNNILSMDDSYFMDLLRTKTHENFSFGFSFGHNPSFSEFATILEALVNIVRTNKLL